MFEEANFHLTDEINNLCDVRNQMVALLSTEDRVRLNTASKLKFPIYL